MLQISSILRSAKTKMANKLIGIWHFLRDSAAHKKLETQTFNQNSAQEQLALKAARAKEQIPSVQRMKEGELLAAGSDNPRERDDVWKAGPQILHAQEPRRRAHHPIVKKKGSPKRRKSLFWMFSLAWAQINPRKKRKKKDEEKEKQELLFSLYLQNKRLPQRLKHPF